MDIEKDRRRFARRRNCWFIARGIKADWKDPKTYMWLINEFGKISPARVSGVSTKHQRFVNSAIKRARQLNIVSHLSDAVLK
ncbi:MAG: 30S ribosomal protein S18 [Bdellovibrionales bacterium RIFOXYB1_FULL_37_110]|nr:MAG: 30S ribosomal protein S18 [Bdellovibrionales bacterium RIFOXYA1_FULL_38_20]OFZ52628.1 MAG: 30S ribosomal protein S18 [Bdellovibrionales bacterium RIFOXYC1_FULL_37_79]OFZ59799.1 MAG: 30S ribosomal protein S18 [Bdellovibrionales bacterium RIFOXYB1_FULL_37_110]OFZ62663.1 MAG: 30S ribosomal protein S18 [Bdellovibrionales bacterium RIFOXYD1_FULL_36_51]OFZ67056.1 MAG: 30S ribosomal protein S18 [Bdellovibrionales bacterium RIFOXYB2_FULL_36_6]